MELTSESRFRKRPYIPGSVKQNPSGAEVTVEDLLISQTRLDTKGGRLERTLPENDQSVLLVIGMTGECSNEPIDQLRIFRCRKKNGTNEAGEYFNPDLIQNDANSVLVNRPISPDLPEFACVAPDCIASAGHSAALVELRGDYRAARSMTVPSEFRHPAPD